MGHPAEDEAPMTLSSVGIEDEEYEGEAAKTAIRSHFVMIQHVQDLYLKKKSSKVSAN